MSGASHLVASASIPLLGYHLPGLTAEEEEEAAADEGGEKNGG